MSKILLFMCDVRSGKIETINEPLSLDTPMEFDSFTAAFELSDTLCKRIADAALPFEQYEAFSTATGGYVTAKGKTIYVYSAVRV